MATPPLMVELKCPNCRGSHWEIDHDFRWSGLGGESELSFKERTYDCPACNKTGAGYRVLQKSPPEFLLQPHPLYPMTTREFAHWLSVFRAAFPSDDRLDSVGVYWYPGKSDEQARKLRDAGRLGAVQGYWLSLSNQGPDDERIRVCVQGKGEAHFWCGPLVELDHCYYGFEAEELEKIRELLTARTSDIQSAWKRFSTEAKEAQAVWLRKLGAYSAAGPHHVSHTVRMAMRRIWRILRKQW